MCIGRLGLGSGGPSNPPLATCSGGHSSTRTSGSCTTGVISSPGNDGRGGLGRRGEETEEAVEVGREGGGLVASQMEGGGAVATVGWLGSAGGRDSRFPTRRPAKLTAQSPTGRQATRQPGSGLASGF